MATPDLLRRIRDALTGIWQPRSARPLGHGAAVGPRPLYVFFDEAGDLDFGRLGSRYFLCGVLVTRDPWPLMEALNDLRKEMFRGDFIPRAFHASEDRQEVRDAVMEAIRQVGGFDAHVFVTEKVAVPGTHRDPLVFYSFMADFALRMVLARHPSDEPIFVITDELPVRSKREAVVKGFKASLAQVIDYVNWAAFRRHERQDDRSHELVKEYIVQEVRLDWKLVR